MDEVWQKRQKRDIIGMNFYDWTSDLPSVEYAPPFRQMYIIIMADLLSRFMILPNT